MGRGMECAMRIKGTSFFGVMKWMRSGLYNRPAIRLVWPLIYWTVNL